jgi:hypothetical protein
MTEAKVLADEVLFKKDPMRVKHVRHAWGRTPYVPGYGGGEYFPLEEIPMYFSLQEQLELAAQRILQLPRLSFFVRPATEEGSVSQFVSKITIREVLKDPQTNDLVFPDETLIQQLKSRLAKRSGIPVATILKEQEARLKTPVGASVPLRREEPAQLPPIGSEPQVFDSEVFDRKSQTESVAQTRGGRRPAKDVAQEPRQRPPKKTTPPPPVKPTVQLNEEQRAFLDFLIAHPDTPISGVYKSLSLSWYKGNQYGTASWNRGWLQR